MADRVLLSCVHVFDRLHLVAPELERHGVAFDVADVEGQQLSADDLLQIIDRYDGVLAGDDEFTAEVIEAADRLRVIAKWGIGIDAIDTEAARRRDISVLNTPGVFGDEIADYALAYLLLLTRHQHRIDAEVRAGGWPKPRGRSIAGLTLGVVGLGSSGRELSTRARASKMEVIGSDVHRPDDAMLERIGCEFVPFPDLLERADAVSLHAPLTGETRHLINEASLRAMRRGALLINVSRGGLIDTEALIAALDSGQLAGAALDVFEEEPLPHDHRLTRFANVILGCHNASNTEEAVDRTTVQAVANLLTGLGYR